MSDNSTSSAASSAARRESQGDNVSVGSTCSSRSAMQTTTNIAGVSTGDLATIGAEVKTSIHGFPPVGKTDKPRGSASAAMRSRLRRVAMGSQPKGASSAKEPLTNTEVKRNEPLAASNLVTKYERGQRGVSSRASLPSGKETVGGDDVEYDENFEPIVERSKAASGSKTRSVLKKNVSEIAAAKNEGEIVLGKKSEVKTPKAGKVGMLESESPAYAKSDLSLLLPKLESIANIEHESDNDQDEDEDEDEELYNAADESILTTKAKVATPHNTKKSHLPVPVAPGTVKKSTPNKAAMMMMTPAARESHGMQPTTTAKKTIARSSLLTPQTIVRTTAGSNESGYTGPAVTPSTATRRGVGRDLLLTSSASKYRTKSSIRPTTMTMLTPGATPIKSMAGAYGAVSTPMFEGVSSLINTSSADGEMHVPTVSPIHSMGFTPIGKGGIRSMMAQVFDNLVLSTKQGMTPTVDEGFDSELVEGESMGQKRSRQPSTRPHSSRSDYPYKNSNLLVNEENVEGNEVGGKEYSRSSSSMSMDKAPIAPAAEPDVTKATNEMENPFDVSPMSYNKMMKYILSTFPDVELEYERQVKEGEIKDVQDEQTKFKKIVDLIRLRQEDIIKERNSLKEETEIYQQICEELEGKDKELLSFQKAANEKFEAYELQLSKKDGIIHQLRSALTDALAENEKLHST